MNRAATRRAGVLAYTPRSREYTRRVLRALGYSPLVFTSIDEILGLGTRASTLDVVVLGDAPDTDSHGRSVVEALITAVGPDVPLLQAPLVKRPRAAPRLNEADGVATTPRFFSDLYRAILSFLDSHGLASTPRLLCWDRYAFHPIERIVAFNDEEVKLDGVDFDIALELFFTAGQPVSKRWLRSMLPSGEQGANWHRIDNIGCTVDDLRVALQLHGPSGWTLETLGDEGYRLSRSQQPPSSPAARAPAVARPARRRAEMRVP